MKPSSRLAFLAALLMSAACTVHGVDVPPLAGPSEMALSVSVTAIPDMLAQDGASQSAIAVLVVGPDGKGVAGQTLRIETLVDGSMQDFGLVSARSVVTNADGRATVTYTAPPPGPTTGGIGTLVTIVATPYGNNFMNTNMHAADIRLHPPSVVLPPASAPRARFAVSPTPVTAGVAAIFDAGSSCATQSTCASTSGITNFAWSFGDGSFANGQTTSKTFAASGTYNVSLTVTNDRGLSTTESQSVTVSAGQAPTAAFIVTPQSPRRVGSPLYFNADQSAAVPGRQIVQYSWNFGDGTPGVTTGFLTQHTYTTAGTYSVILSVLDDAGQKATSTQTVTIAP